MTKCGKNHDQSEKEFLIVKGIKNHYQQDYFQTSTVENKKQVLQKTKHRPCHC